MPSRHVQEGYLFIDHRASPGLTEAEARECGGIAVTEGTLFQSATYTCSHCSWSILKHPLRVRERAYCSTCDDYICDACEFKRQQPGYIHRNFTQIADEIMEHNFKKRN